MITDRHSVASVRRMLDLRKPFSFIIESENSMCNLKTLYIAQKLKKQGYRDVELKFYKGDLLKVLFSRTPQRSRTEVGGLKALADPLCGSEVVEIGTTA